MGSEAVVGGDERDERLDDGSGDDQAGAAADEPDVPLRSGQDATGWILFLFGGVQFHFFWLFVGWNFDFDVDMWGDLGMWSIIFLFIYFVSLICRVD